MQSLYREELMSRKVLGRDCLLSLINHSLTLNAELQSSADTAAVRTRKAAVCKASLVFTGHF